LPRAWLQDRKRDYYYKRAKVEKYRSRASYKLLQAVSRYHFIKDGNTVLDLGAAPGGWTQAARKNVGSRGFVLGVDLKPIEAFDEPNTQTINGDIEDEGTLREILEVLPRGADAVISDASPNISGVWEVDHARQMSLAMRALDIALETLRPGGSFFVKVFQGDMLDDFIRKIKSHFQVVRVVKPEASRGKSSELFILGLKLREPAQ